MSIKFSCVTLRHMSFCAGVVVAVSFQQIDDTSNAKTGTQSDNEGLKHFDSRVKEIHSRFLLRKRACGRTAPHLKSSFFWLQTAAGLICWCAWGLEKKNRKRSIIPREG